MRKAATIFVIVSLVAMIFSGFQPSTAENPGGEIIGEYHQLGSTDDLTTSHTSWVDDVLEVEGPPLTDKLKVETRFLEGELGAWSSDQEFTLGDEVVEFDAQDASIVNLSLGPEPVFTKGASDQIEFLERPMWISAEQAEYGDPITLDMDDGDSAGQQIYIGKEWLWTRGIHRPNATHEDGTILQVNQTNDRKGFIVDVLHFSKVTINPTDLTVIGRQDSMIFTHTGEKRWYEDDERLEIDVHNESSGYDLLIERDWVDMNIPNATVKNYTRGQEMEGGMDFYVIYLDPLETPATIIVESPWTTFLFTLNLTEFKEGLLAGELVSLPIQSDDHIDLNLTVPPITRAVELNPGTSQNQTVIADRLHVEAVGNHSGLGFLNHMNDFMMGSLCIESLPWSPMVLIYIEGVDDTTIGTGGTRMAVHSRESAPNCNSGHSGGGGGDPPPDPPDPPEYPYNPPEPATTRDVTPDVHMEDSYFDGWCCWLEAIIHANDAFWVQRDMWEDYTGNKMNDQYWSTDFWGYDDIEPADVPGTYCDQKLQGFTDYIDEIGRVGIPNNVFTLISGDDEMGCTGSAWPGSVGNMPDERDNINYGLDRPMAHLPYYGKSNYEHLGVLIAQEIGHNWGHPGHECFTIDGDYSAMADSGDCQAPWDDRKFWLHYDDPDKPGNARDSTQEIIDGTAGYD